MCVCVRVGDRGKEIMEKGKVGLSQPLPPLPHLPPFIAQLGVAGLDQLHDRNHRSERSVFFLHDHIFFLFCLNQALLNLQICISSMVVGDFQIKIVTTSAFFCICFLLRGSHDTVLRSYKTYVKYCHY